MNLTALERSLRELILSGEVGTPGGAANPSFQHGLGENPAEQVSLFEPLIRLVAPDFQGSVLARQHPNGKQLSVLWTSGQGASVFLTLVSAPIAQASLQVLLIGNHGMAKLTGGTAWIEEMSPGSKNLWSEEIAESLKRGTSLPVGAS